MRHILLFLLPFTYSSLIAQNIIPKDVLNVINKTKTNKTELLNAANYYKKNTDSLKQQAMFFLLRNMDIHYSSNYYWIDSMKNKIEFNELEYSTFQNSINGFEELKAKYGKLRPKTIIYRDIDTITADYLIKNINQAFQVWKTPIASTISFTDFCEYILPYRVYIEPLQNWRDVYQKKFNWMFDSVKNYQPKNMVKYLIKDVNNWFTSMYGFEKKTEPLPRLSALQILHRKKGFCEDVADLSVFALRSQGICSSVDAIPFWATSSGNHTLNFMNSNKGENVHFDVLFKTDNMDNTQREFKLIREPGKVFRYTYSKQKNALPNFLDTSYIPKGILRHYNILDVTKEYWMTTNVKIPVNEALTKPAYVFACVLNYLQWQPIWWSNKLDSSKVEFTDMSMGVVYLPQCYFGKKLRPVGYPIAVGYNHTQVLKPDLKIRHKVELTEQEHYLRFQTGKKYKLFYWYNQWRLLESKVAQEKTTSLTFDNVPKNALLILVLENGNLKERPFMITDDNRRVWF